MISAKSSQFLQVHKLIENDHKRIIKVSVFQAMGSSTVGKAWEQEVSTTDSTRVKGSSPVEVSFLLNLFFCNTILADLTEWSIYGKTWFEDVFTPGLVLYG